MQVTKPRLMTHLVAGYPNWDLFNASCVALAEAGASSLEIQLPFSDPMADGPLIMQANAAVLAKGYCVQDALKHLKALTATIRIPVYVMSYLNVFYAQGVSHFAQQLKHVGVSGCIVPDLSFEANQKEGVCETIRQEGLDFVAVLAPLQQQTRLVEMRSFCKDLVYVPARAGVTGQTTQLTDTFSRQLSLIKETLNCPIAVGFGIKNLQHLQALEGLADVAVIGSAILDCINQTKDQGIPAVDRALREFIKHLLSG